MAVAELTPCVLSRNTGFDLTTDYQVVIDSATGAYIDYFDTAQNNQTGRLILIAGRDSDQAGTPTLRILTSTENPFTGSGTDALEDDMSSETAGFADASDDRITILGPFETARFVDTDGYINIEISTADTCGKCYLTALVIP